MYIANQINSNNQYRKNFLRKYEKNRNKLNDPLKPIFYKVVEICGYILTVMGCGIVIMAMINVDLVINYWVYVLIWMVVQILVERILDMNTCFFRLYKEQMKSAELMAINSTFEEIYKGTNVLYKEHCISNFEQQYTEDIWSILKRVITKGIWIILSIIIVTLDLVITQLNNKDVILYLVIITVFLQILVYAITHTRIEGTIYELVTKDYRRCLANEYIGLNSVEPQDGVEPQDTEKFSYSIIFKGNKYNVSLRGWLNIAYAKIVLCAKRVKRWIKRVCKNMFNTQFWVLAGCILLYMLMISLFNIKSGADDLLADILQIILLVLVAPCVTYTVIIEKKRHQQLIYRYWNIYMPFHAQMNHILNCLYILDGSDCYRHMHWKQSEGTKLLQQDLEITKRELKKIDETLNILAKRLGQGGFDEQHIIAISELICDTQYKVMEVLDGDDIYNTEGTIKEIFDATFSINNMLRELWRIDFAWNNLIVENILDNPDNGEQIKKTIDYIIYMDNKEETKKKIF